MVTLSELLEEDLGLAATGQRLFAHHRLAYLATTRRDRSPRLHPVTPDETATGLFVAVNHQSPKGWDLAHDGRYALHAPRGKSDEEFVITGEARRVDDDATRLEIAESAGHVIRDTDWLFEFLIEDCLQGYWVNAGPPAMAA